MKSKLESQGQIRGLNQWASSSGRRSGSLFTDESDLESKKQLSRKPPHSPYADVGEIRQAYRAGVLGVREVLFEIVCVSGRELANEAARL